MASNAVSKKIELATIKENIFKVNIQIDKAVIELKKAKGILDGTASTLKSIVLDETLIKTLKTQANQLKELGAPPNAELDFTLDDFDITKGAIADFLSAINTYNNATKGIDI